MTRIFILTTFLLIGVLQSHGQRLDNLALECTVKDMDEGNKIEGASVIVLQDGAEIENVRTGRNGRFGLYLDFNHEFSIVISKNGFVTVRLAAKGQPDAVVAQRLDAVNPLYIPRNHLVENALQAASEDGDLRAFEKLLAIVTRPFDERALDARAALPGTPEQTRGYRTFCGT